MHDGAAVLVGVVEGLGEEFIGNGGEFTSFNGDADVFYLLDEVAGGGVEGEVDGNFGLVGGGEHVVVGDERGVVG